MVVDLAMGYLHFEDSIVEDLGVVISSKMKGAPDSLPYCIYTLVGNSMVGRKEKLDTASTEIV
jgi:hypothetical protein